MNAALITFVLFAPADLAPAPAPTPEAKPAPEAAPEPVKVDPLKEAAKLIDRKANNLKNLQAGIDLYEANLAGADQRAQVLGWVDTSRAYLRIGDIHKDKKKKLAAFEAGKAAGEKAVKASKGASKKLRAEALAWMTFNLAKVGETNGVMNSLFMVGDLKKNLNQALKLDPNNSYARATLATIFHALPGLVGGSDSKAIELYEESIKRSPGFGSGMCDLAKLYMDTNKKDKAKALYEQILAIKKPEFAQDHWKFDKPCAKRGLKKLAK